MGGQLHKGLSLSPATDLGERFANNFRCTEKQPRGVLSAEFQGGCKFGNLDRGTALAGEFVGHHGLMTLERQLS